MIDHLMLRIDRYLTLLESGLIAFFSLFALLVGVMQVVLRYAFNSGFEWSESIFVLSTVFAMLIAGSRGIKVDAHVRVDIVTHLLSPRVRKILLIVAHLGSMLLCAYYFYSGMKFVQFTKMMDTASPDTGIKDWVVYSLVPLTMGLFCLRYVLELILKPEETESSHLGINDSL